MAAGSSARAEALRTAATVRDLEAEAARLAQRSQNFDRAAEGERRTAELLGPLTAYGFHPLHDRRWPGTAHANIDHLVVGPSGVFVVDTKSWTGDVRVDGEGLWQGQALRDETVEAMQLLADAVRDGLAGLGLPPLGVRPVLAFDGRRDARAVTTGVWVIGAEVLSRELLREARHLTVSQVEQVLRGLLDLFPPIDDSTAPQVPAPRAAAAEEPPAPPDALFTSEDLEQDAVAAALKAPLEDWMVFLHPRQADFARRRFNGPALLRGPAGTGKTVVALHRMAYLAERRASRVLFLSFVRTLPAVQRAAYERLSPATMDRVEFASLHAWASQLLRHRRTPVVVDQQACTRAYDDAWMAVGKGSLLDRPGCWTYWQEEVQQVVRGRRVPDLATYLVLPRTGRGARLGANQREAVWRLKEQYEANLRARGLRDWDDLLEAALTSVRERPLAVPYASVVVDEVQDLTMTGLQLLAAIAVDGPDSLLLVGDSRQAVFAGGVSPSAAGIQVTGRSTVLEINYRNSAEVLEFAAPLVADDADVLGEGEPLPASTTAERSGLTPLVAHAPRTADLEVALLSCLTSTHAAGRSPWGGMAVLASRRADVRRLEAVLGSAGIPAVSLERWSGNRLDAVKVGTIKRAKGLEFPFVYLPGVDVALLPGAAEPDDEVDRDKLLRARRELYVAATRARDGLWVGVLRPEAGTRARVSASPAPVAPVPDRPATSVYALARLRFGVEVEGGPSRFGQAGWMDAGPLLILCKRCRTPMHGWRRVYEIAGRAFRYWALVCATCRTASAPQDLGDADRKALQEHA